MYRKHSIDFKMKMIQEYLNSDLGFCKLSEKYKIETEKDTIVLYKIYGRCSLVWREVRIMINRLRRRQSEVRLETGHSKLRQKKIQWYHIKFTEGVHEYGERQELR